MAEQDKASSSFSMPTTAESLLRESNASGSSSPQTTQNPRLEPNVTKTTPIAPDPGRQLVQVSEGLNTPIAPALIGLDAGIDYQMENDPERVLREQDRFLPIANVGRIMKRVVPESGKVAKDAKECCQECVSEFISFISSEASERCQSEKRKTINGEDILYALQTLGFDPYLDPLKMFLTKYRDAFRTDLASMGAEEAGGTAIQQPTTPARSIAQPMGSQIVIPADASATIAAGQQVYHGTDSSGQVVQILIPAGTGQPPNVVRAQYTTAAPVQIAPGRPAPPRTQLEVQPGQSVVTTTSQQR